jgi:hypothetical protein
MTPFGSIAIHPERKVSSVPCVAGWLYSKELEATE